MTSLWKSSASATVLALFLSSSAYAADPYNRGLKDGPDVAAEAPSEMVNWSGCYVGAQAGWSDAVLGDENGSGGLATNGFIGGGRIGCDVARGRLLIGGYGEYNWSNAALEIGSSTLLEKDNEWTAGIRVGVIAAPRTLVYGLAGYTQADFSDGYGNSETFDGWTAGGGIELAIASNVTAGIEATHTWYDESETFGDGISFDDTRIMGVLRIKLTSGLPYLGN